MLRARSLWVNVCGTGLLLAFSTFDPIIAALALGAIAVFFYTLYSGHSLPRELLHSVVPCVGVLLILEASAVEAEVPQNATARSYGFG